MFTLENKTHNQEETKHPRLCLQGFWPPSLEIYQADYYQVCIPYPWHVLFQLHFGSPFTEKQQGQSS